MDSGDTKKVKVKPYNWVMFASSIEDLLEQLKKRISGKFNITNKYSDDMSSSKKPEKGFDWEVELDVD
jgi:hypothetical protein